MKILLLKNSIACLVFLVLCSCSVAPLTSPKTARPLGKSNKHITTGMSPVPTLDFGYGASDNWDVGAGVEAQLGYVLSLWNKYSFNASAEYNKKVAYAFYSGAFSGVGDSKTYGAFIAPVVSYKHSWFEIYLVPKLNYLAWDASSFDLEDDDGETWGTVEYESGSLTYMQYTLGFNFWFGENHGLNITTLVLQDSTTNTYGIEYMWRL